MLTQRARRDPKSQRRADDLVITTITHHADTLLRTARRNSLCADDAADAYQRALEIFLKNAARLDPDRVLPWLHTVVKHEALAVRKARQKLVGAEEFDADAVESLHTPSPDERLLAFEDVNRAAEALQGLKPQEVRALWLRMEGRTYKQIAEDLGWTYTKVNRCVTEGRRAFLARYAGIESGAECARLEGALSAFVDGELGGKEVVVLRRHLRSCPGCRGTLKSMRSGDRSLRAVLPVALVVAGPDGGDSAVGALVRIYEAIAHNVQALGVKAQLAVDATGVAKVAAVAGAAAAVAGGGAATVERVAADPTPSARTAAREPAVARTPKAVAATPVATPDPAQAANRTAPVVVRRTAQSSQQHHKPARPPAEFVFERAAIEPRAAPEPRRTQPVSRSQRAGGEFDLEP
jgi:RNA polymerase sigma factor (sigma-70 family)